MLRSPFPQNPGDIPDRAEVLLVPFRDRCPEGSRDGLGDAPGTILGSNLVLKRLPRVPRTFNFAHPYGILATFSKIAFYAFQMLLDCSWGLLGLSWGLPGAVWGVLSPPSGHPGTLFGRSWPLLRRSSSTSWSSWGTLGRSWGARGQP